MNLQEQICEAVQVVAQQEISKISFDKTIVGTIIDDSTASQGYYWVISNKLKFKAYSDNKYYKNNEVQILIPNNDYSNKKIIIGLNADTSENTASASFLTAKNDILPMLTLFEQNGIISDTQYEINRIIEPNTYNALVISGKFQFDNSHIEAPSYGIRLQFTTADGVNKVYELDSLAQMSGSINNFIVPFYQEAIYTDFGSLSQIIKTNIEFYGHAIISDVKIYLGCDTSQITAEKELRIYTNDKITYGNGDKNKTLQVLWIDKTEDVQTVSPTWYRWSHSQQNWKNINYTSNQIQVTLDSAQTGERFKAVYTVNGISYTSNIITFVNMSGSLTALLFDEANALRINLGSNATDAFPLYGPDYHIINLLESSKKRQLYVTYEPEFEENKLSAEDWKKCKIKWIIPNRASMLLAQIEEDDGFTHKDSGIANEYEKEINADADKSFYFAIKPIYTPVAKENTIKCVLTLPSGRTVYAEKSFNFSVQGASGTDYTLAITQNNDLPYVVSNQSVTLEAFLYDKDGVECQGATEFSWKPLLHAQEVTQGKTLTLSDIQECELYEVTIWYNQMQLTAYHSLIVSIWNNIRPDMPYTFYYDTFGNLTGNGTYKLSIAPVNLNYCTLNLYQNGQLIEDTEWYQQYQQYLPKLDGYKLIAPNTINTSLNVIAELICGNVESGYSWKQPISFMHSVYESQLLNTWDGARFEDDNVILSAMLGAGKKNSRNQFTGVLLGDVGKGADILYSGILGFQDGGASFGLGTDGSAFIGTSGSGQIKFDPSYEGEVVIKSANFNKMDKTGGQIKLGKGELEFYHQNGDYLKFTEADGLSIKTSKLDLTSNALGVNIIPGTQAGLLNGWRIGGWGDIDSSVDYMHEQNSTVNGGNGQGYVLQLQRYNHGSEPISGGWIAMSYDFTDFFKRYAVDNKLTCSFSFDIECINTDIDSINGLQSIRLMTGFPAGFRREYPAHPEAWQDDCVINYTIEDVGPPLLHFKTTMTKANCLVNVMATGDNSTFQNNDGKVFFSILLWGYSALNTNPALKFRITNLKVEAGSTCTTWAPSPSDEIIDIFSLGSMDQGIYLKNGRLSINASYIKTGIITSDNLKIDLTNGEIDAKNNFSLCAPSGYGETLLNGNGLFFNSTAPSLYHTVKLGYDEILLQSKNYSDTTTTTSSTSFKDTVIGFYQQIRLDSTKATALNIRTQNGSLYQVNGITPQTRVYALCQSNGTLYSTRLANPASNYYQIFIENPPTEKNINNYYLVSQYLSAVEVFNKEGSVQSITHRDYYTASETKRKITGFKLHCDRNNNITLAMGDGGNNVFYFNSTTGLEV